jgi:phosphatidylserine/phosphatidylglycerophosphate/cardiolipin synthase-like enzyme
MFAVAAALAILPLTIPEQAPTVELVESAPIETALDHADIRNADVVWRELIDAAKSSLDFAEFYASDHPGSRLEPIVEAIEKAADRGVRVRFLAEKKFQATYPETLERLAKKKGIEVRAYDMKRLTDGVLHAKYFLVDGTITYLGSQNFDWRSLEHIQELGLVVRASEVTRVFAEVFDADWALANGAKREDALKPVHESEKFPLVCPGGEKPMRITPVCSPKGLLPDEQLWDLPRIVALIDSAQKSVRVQLLTYKMMGRDEYFADIENALRRAATRNAQVQLLVADWCMRKGTIEGLQALEPLPNVDVKLVTIPQWSGGFVPFARVVHSKYVVVDGKSAWVGTSNWERGYFYASRNVGLIIEGGDLPERLVRFFTDTWDSEYSKRVDPCATYTPPKTGD